MSAWIVILSYLFLFMGALKAQDIIDVSEQGISDEIRNSRQLDRDEAIMDAKLKAIQKAGINVQSVTTVESFQLKKDWIESKAQACILPGFQIIDVGYGTDGHYHVVLVGKISKSSSEEESEGDKKYRDAKIIMEHDKDRGIKLMQEVVDKYPRCIFANDALLVIIKNQISKIRNMERRNELCLKLQAILSSVPYVADQQRLVMEKKQKQDKIRNKIGLEMIYIPGGTFQMGNKFDNFETDIYTATVSDFYLGKTEVTVAQYRTFCDSTGRSMPLAPSWGWQDNHPIVQVSWDDARAFCDWAGCRLPTEEEWEYAAREGGKQVRFGNGKNIADPSEINFNGNEQYEGHDIKYVNAIAGVSRKQTTPAGSFKPNALGFYDMSGNASEWCDGWFVGLHRPYRVLRGGCWKYGSSDCSVSNHECWNSPNVRSYDYYGFRCAK